jgi:hypothetical protein
VLGGHSFCTDLNKYFISFHFIYSFSTSVGKWSASRPGRALPLEKGPPVSIVQEAGWAPEPVWTQRLEEKILCLCRGPNPGRPVRSQTLYWLSYPDSQRRPKHHDIQNKINERVITTKLKSIYNVLIAKTATTSFEDMEKFKYLGTTVTYDNNIHEVWKSILNSGNTTVQLRIIYLPVSYLNYRYIKLQFYEGKTYTEDDWDEGDADNMWTWESISNKKMEKLHTYRGQTKHFYG